MRAVLNDQDLLSRQQACLAKLADVFGTTEPLLDGPFIEPLCIYSPELQAALDHPEPASLLARLAQPEQQRTLLIGEPGSGKTRFIRELIVRLATGEGLEDAPGLAGLMPVPLMINELLPLLAPHLYEAWDWPLLLGTLVKNYHRRHRQPPLLQSCFEGQEEEFMHWVQGSDRVIFLVDGLDEVGNSAARGHLKDLIQQGIRACHPGARWLITARPPAVECCNDEPVDVFQHLAGDITTDGCPLEKLQNYLKDHPDPRSSFCVDLGYVLREPVEGGYYRLICIRSLCSRQRLYLTPWSDVQRKSFAQRRLGSRGELWMRQLLAEEVAGEREPARLPFQMSWLAMLSETGQPLPPRLHQLPDATLSHLIERAAAQPGSPLTAAELRTCLARVAMRVQSFHSMPSSLHPSSPPSRGWRTTEPLIYNPMRCNLAVPRVVLLRDLKQWLSGHGLRAADERGIENVEAIFAWMERETGLLRSSGAGAGKADLVQLHHRVLLDHLVAMHLWEQMGNLPSIVEDDYSDSETACSDTFQHPLQVPPEQLSTLADCRTWHDALTALCHQHAGSWSDLEQLMPLIFPKLHGQPELPDPPHRWFTPPLTLNALSLLLAWLQDDHLNLPAEWRDDWLKRLWDAYWYRPSVVLDGSDTDVWYIKPKLLECEPLVRPALKALACSWLEHKAKDGELELDCDPLVTDDLLRETLLQSAPGHDGQPLPVRKLTLWSASQLTSASLETLAALPELTELALKSASQVTTLMPLQQAQKLQVISLSGLAAIKNAEAFQCLANLAQLRSLRLGSLHKLGSLDGFPELNALEELTLSDCPLLTTLTGLPLLPKLKRLTIRDCAAFIGPQGLQELPQLETLEINNCGAFTSTEDFPYMVRLRKVTLKNCAGLTHGSILSGLDGFFALEELEIDSCDDLTVLAGFPCLPVLRRLKISGENVLGNADDWAALAEAAPQLEHLTISRSEALTSLHGIEALQSLRVLEIWSCPNLASHSEVLQLPALQRCDLTSTGVSWEKQDEVNQALKWRRAGQG